MTIILVILEDASTCISLVYEIMITGMVCKFQVILIVGDNFRLSIDYLRKEMSEV